MSLVNTSQIVYEGRLGISSSDEHNRKTAQSGVASNRGDVTLRATENIENR